MYTGYMVGPYPRSPVVLQRACVTLLLRMAGHVFLAFRYGWPACMASPLKEKRVVMCMFADVFAHASPAGHEQQELVGAHLLQAPNLHGLLLRVLRGPVPGNLHAVLPAVSDLAIDAHARPCGIRQAADPVGDSGSRRHAAGRLDCARHSAWRSGEAAV